MPGEDQYQKLLQENTRRFALLREALELLERTYDVDRNLTLAGAMIYPDGAKTPPILWVNVELDVPTHPQLAADKSKSMWPVAILHDDVERVRKLHSPMFTQPGWEGFCIGEGILALSYVMDDLRESKARACDAKYFVALVGPSAQTRQSMFRKTQLYKMGRMALLYPAEGQAGYVLSHICLPEVCGISALPDGRSFNGFADWLHRYRGPKGPVGAYVGYDFASMPGTRLWAAFTDQATPDDVHRAEILAHRVHKSRVLQSIGLTVRVVPISVLWDNATRDWFRDDNSSVPHNIETATEQELDECRNTIALFLRTNFGNKAVPEHWITDEAQFRELFLAMRCLCGACSVTQGVRGAEQLTLNALIVVTALAAAQANMDPSSIMASIDLTQSSHVVAPALSLEHGQAVVESFFTLVHHMSTKRDLDQPDPVLMKINNVRGLMLTFNYSCTAPVGKDGVALLDAINGSGRRGTACKNYIKFRDSISKWSFPQGLTVSRARCIVQILPDPGNLGTTILEVVPCMV